MNTGISLGIVGSREFDDYGLLIESIFDVLALQEIRQVVSGGAKGADSLAERFAKDFNIPLVVHKANWNKYGKAAGMIRNKTIVEDSDFVIAFWNGKSRGTKNSIELANKIRLCKVVLYEERRTTFNKLFNVDDE